MNSSELRKIRNQSIEKAHTLASRYREETEKVSALISIARATKSKKYLDEARAVTEKMIGEKNVWRSNALSAIADYTHRRIDIEKVFTAIQDKLKYTFKHHQSENDDTDPIYYEAPVLREAAREYAKHGFIQKARTMFLRWNSDSGDNRDSYRMCHIFLGVWEVTKDFGDLLLVRTLAGTNLDNKFRIEALTLVAQVTNDWRDTNALEHEAEEEKDKDKKVTLKLLASLNGSDCNGWLFNEMEKFKESREVMDLFTQVAIKHVGHEPSGEFIEEYESRFTLERRGDLIQSYIKQHEFSKAEIIAEKICSTASGARDWNYSQAARRAELVMADGYVKNGNLDQALKWLSRFEKSHDIFIEAVEVYLHIAQVVGDQLKKKRAEWKPE